MTIESDVHAAIAPVCPRVFAVLAPVRTTRPYVTVQNIGGDPTYYLNRQPADKRVLRLMVKAWANSKTEALDLSRQIEVALMAATAFTARVETEPLDDVETDGDPWLYSELQEFVVIGPR